MIFLKSSQNYIKIKNRIQIDYLGDNTDKQE